MQYLSSLMTNQIMVQIMQTLALAHINRESGLLEANDECIEWRILSNNKLDYLLKSESLFDISLFDLILKFRELYRN